MKEFRNKVVWITGASSGIGEALSYELDRMGCKLILSSRREEQLSVVKNRCQHPENIKILTLDLAAPEAMEAHVVKAWNGFGRIDIVINNAGISQRSRILETELRVFRQLVEINYLGTVALTKAMLPFFVQQQSGHFVTISSLMGKFGSPMRAGYCAAKHALHGFFDVLRMEHQKDGIDVTLICPGFIQTDIAKNALTADGTPQNKEDMATKNGMDVQLFAKKMLRAVRDKKFETYIGGKEVGAVYLKRFFPELLHRIVLRSKVV